LQDHAECPHCGFDPRTEPVKIPAADALEEAWVELARLHQGWVARLHEELNKPSVATTVALLPAPYREQIQAFMQSGALPERVTQQWVEAVNDALQGLEKVVIGGSDLLLALTRPGMPCTVEELHQRFEALLNQQLGDKNRHKIRLEIDW
jgi:23S rRNA A2030 N6-methylase RlmJ